MADNKKKDKLKELAAKAGPIASNSHLLGIKLRDLQAGFVNEPSTPSADADLHTSYGVAHEFQPEDEDSLPLLSVQVKFRLRVVESETEREIFQFSCLLQAEYALNRGIPDEVATNLGAFARSNTLIHVWPYFRELVQSTTWRMGLPQFPIPLFRITDQLDSVTEDAPPDETGGS